MVIIGHYYPPHGQSRPQNRPDLNRLRLGSNPRSQPNPAGPLVAGRDHRTDQLCTACVRATASACNHALPALRCHGTLRKNDRDVNLAQIAAPLPAQNLNGLA